MRHNKPKDRKFHIIYKTTCTITGKFYVGMHSTDVLEDGYLGSGQRLRRSIAKYGEDAHVREILEYAADRASLALRESQIVTPEFRANPLCMNLMDGGFGNYPGRPTSEETRKKLSEHFKTVERTTEWKANISKAHMGKKMSEEAIQNRLNTLKERDYKPSEQAKANQRAGQLSSEKFKQRYRSIIIDGVTYQNGREACAALNLKGSTLANRLASPNWLNYRWADQPEKDPSLVSSRARGAYDVNSTQSKETT
jgi:group I intron endonuclease